MAPLGPWRLGLDSDGFLDRSIPSVTIIIARVIHDCFPSPVSLGVAGTLRRYATMESQSSWLNSRRFTRHDEHAMAAGFGVGLS